MTKGQMRVEVDQILDLLADYQVDEARRRLSMVRAELHNRNAGERSENVSEPVTDEVREGVLKMARDNPGMAQRTIAERFNIHNGRVNEILRGKRT